MLFVSLDRLKLVLGAEKPAERTQALDRRSRGSPSEARPAGPLRLTLRRSSPSGTN